MSLKNICEFIALLGLLTSCVSASPKESPQAKLSANLGVDITSLIIDLRYFSENLTPSLKSYRAYSKTEVTPDNFKVIEELLDKKWRSACRIPAPFISESDFLFKEISSQAPTWWTPNLADNPLIIGWQTDNGYIKLKYEETNLTLFLFIEGGMPIACIK